MPLVACRVDVVNVSMKLGMACDRGSKMPRPPLVMLICAMSKAWWGSMETPSSLERNCEMMWLVAEMRGPSQSVQLGGGSSML
jgi:hypothetical protein